MRARRIVAGAAGVAGAALAHALDVAGLLPFVHESVEVRTGMSFAVTLGWLVAAGPLAAAVASRPVVGGAMASLVVGGAPELLTRHDFGAALEPAAMAGALLQWLLLLLVLSLVVAIGNRLAAPTLRRQVVPAHMPPMSAQPGDVITRHHPEQRRPRAPPLAPLPDFIH